MSLQKQQRFRKRQHVDPRKKMSWSSCENKYFMKKVNRQVVHICKDTLVQNIAKYFNEHGTQGR